MLGTEPESSLRAVIAPAPFWYFCGESDHDTYSLVSSFILFFLLDYWWKPSWTSEFRIFLACKVHTTWEVPWIALAEASLLGRGLSGQTWGNVLKCLHASRKTGTNSLARGKRFKCVYGFIPRGLEISQVYRITSSHLCCNTSMRASPHEILACSTGFSLQLYVGSSGKLRGFYSPHLFVLFFALGSHCKPDWQPLAATRTQHECCDFLTYFLPTLTLIQDTGQNLKQTTSPRFSASWVLAPVWNPMSRHPSTLVIFCSPSSSLTFLVHKPGPQAKNHMVWSRCTRFSLLWVAYFYVAMILPNWNT